MVNVCYSYPVVKEGVFTGINKIWQPLELAYACAKLKEFGHYAVILDSNALRVEPGKTGEHAVGFDRVYVSSTSYDRWECPHLDIAPTIETVRSVKEKNPNATVFLVGAHATVRPQEMMDLCGCDAVIVGEPEDVIVDTANAADFRTVEGVGYMASGRLVLRQRTKPVDLNALPLPDFTGLPMEEYFFDMLGGEYAVVEASRGCPFQCSYCLKKMFGSYRRKGFPKVKAEILHLMGDYGVKRINFVDLEFTVNRDLVVELCDWVISEKIALEWSCQTRLDSVDLELLKKMRTAGCKLVMYGVESASERILTQIGKNITVSDFRAGMAATKEAGIKSVCFFIFGFPGETREERDATVALAMELDPDYASFFLVRPYLGTRCYYENKGDSPGLFPAAIGEKDEILALKDYCDMAFKRYYLRPKMVYRRFLSGGFKNLAYQLKVLSHKAGVSK